jgi:predicted transcriptional regulator
MGETEGRKKVVKDISFKYHILSDVIVSPVRIGILNKLFESSPEGLSYDELSKIMSVESEILRYHLNALVKDGIAEKISESGKYTLSKNGLDFYYDLGKAAMKVKDEGLLSADFASSDFTSVDFNTGEDQQEKAGNK